MRRAGALVVAAVLATAVAVAGVPVALAYPSLALSFPGDHHTVVADSNDHNPGAHFSMAFGQRMTVTWSGITGGSPTQLGIICTGPTPGVPVFTNSLASGSLSYTATADRTGCFVYTYPYSSARAGSGSIDVDIDVPAPTPTPTPTAAPTATPTATPAPTEDTRPVALSSEDRARLDAIAAGWEPVHAFVLVVAFAAGVVMVTGAFRK